MFAPEFRRGYTMMPLLEEKLRGVLKRIGVAFLLGARLSMVWTCALGSRSRKSPVGEVVSTPDVKAGAVPSLSHAGERTSFDLSGVLEDSSCAQIQA